MICDSCGASGADHRHIRERIERLELATRFRPVHINVLVLDAAPPARTEDYFYRATKDRSVRSPESRAYFDGLIGCAGTRPNAEIEEESALGAFHRRGLFLAHVIECPIQGQAELAAAVQRAAPTLLKRLQASYRPKYVALLSQQLGELILVLQDAGWGDRLVLEDGKPFAGASVLGDRLAEISGKAT